MKRGVLLLTVGAAVASAVVAAALVGYERRQPIPREVPLRRGRPHQGYDDTGHQ